MVIVDKLSAWILPWVLLSLIREPRRTTLYSVDSTGLGAMFARWATRFLGYCYDALDFRYDDVVDEQGISIGRRIYYFDLTKVHQKIVSRSLSRIGETHPQFGAFLRKGVVSGTISSTGSLAHALYLIQVNLWVTRRRGEHRSLLFLRARAWRTEIQCYADQCGVTVRWTPASINISLVDLVKRLVGPRVLRVLRHVRGLLKRERITTGGIGRSNRILADYHGHLTLARTELN